MSQNSIINEIEKIIEDHEQKQCIADIANSEYLGEGKYSSWESADKAKYIGEILNMEILGFGSKRVVLEYKNMALKIPIESDGILQNEKEFFLYYSVNRNIKKYFTPCIGGTDLFLIFEKVERIDKRSNSKLQKNIDSIITEIKKEGVELEDCDRIEQFGFLNKDLVILDYGL